MDFEQSHVCAYGIHAWTEHAFFKAVRTECWRTISVLIQAQTSEGGQVRSRQLSALTGLKCKGGFNIQNHILFRATVCHCSGYNIRTDGSGVGSNLNYAPLDPIWMTTALFLGVEAWKCVLYRAYWVSCRFIVPPHMCM